MNPAAFQTASFASPVPRRAEVGAPGLHVIYRPKLSGIGLHYGVLLVGPDGRQQGVRHYGPDGWEAATSLAEFAQGLPVMAESYVPLDAAAATRWMTVSFGGCDVPYDLLGSNCEHQAKWLATGERESVQANVLGLSLFTGFIALLAYLGEPERGRAHSA